MGTKRGTLDQARAAKRSLEAKLRRVPEVNGVGITRVDGLYGLKVNLASDTHAAIPSQVNGVPVRTEVVGRIRARGVA